MNVHPVSLCPTSDSGVILKPKIVPKEPAPFAVVLHNDPFTPRAFVVLTLRTCFAKTEAEASDLMNRAHVEGVAIVGLFTREIAEMKAARANDFAAKHGRVLLFTAEKQ